MKVLFLSLVLAGAAVSARAALTPAEKQVSQGLAPEAQKGYADTREYVHAAQKVAKGQASALSLPDEPKDFDATYVTADEQKAIDKALDLNIAAMINGIHIS
jgi:hypothetical protein